MNKKFEAMKFIRDEVLELGGELADLRRTKGYLPVIGEGNHDADIMFIGEAPGKNEAETGKPFCGASGRVLDELLGHIGVDRQTVYVVNILKDRPPANRDPKPEEIAVYTPFLDRQIETIQPTVIATLGRFAMEYIMKKFALNSDIEPISKIHGKVFEVQDKNGKEIKLVPLFHPAVAVYDASRKDELKKDFDILKELAN